MFDSWFYSKKLLESVMEVGANLIGMVKKNTKELCKDNIEEIKKY